MYLEPFGFLPRPPRLVGLRVGSSSGVVPVVWCFTFVSSEVSSLGDEVACIFQSDGTESFSF